MQNVRIMGDMSHLIKMTKSMSTYSDTQVMMPWVKLTTLSCHSIGSENNKDVEELTTKTEASFVYIKYNS